MSDLNVKFMELKDKYNSLQTDRIYQSNYVLELQSTIAEGVEESGQLQKDLKKVQHTLASIEQASAKKDGEILHLRSQLSNSRQLVKTQRACLDVAEDDKNRLRR